MIRVVIDPVDGEKRYINHQNFLHREDGPAAVRPNGGYHYYTYGVQSSVDHPCSNFSDGRKIWLIDDCINRAHGPALDYPNGLKRWANGKRRQWPRL